MSSPALLVALFVVPPPSAAEAHRLAAHASNLTHPRYAVREAAQRHLVAAGLPARRALEKAAAAADPEAAARAAAAWDAILAAQVDALRPLPEIDAAWRDVALHAYDYGRVPADMGRLLTLSLASPAGGGPWSQYYRACEWWVRERLAAGASPHLLRLVLADLHRRDADFLARAGDAGRALVVDPAAYLRDRK